MLKPYKRICSLIIIVLLFSNANATNYYVATDGNSSNNGKSITSPFKDIVQAIALVSTGDTIFIRNGTYPYTSRINITKSGTSDKRICIMAYPPDIKQLYPTDGRPVFDFSAMAAGSSNQGFSLSGSQYLHIKGLKIKGAGDNGMLLKTSNNNIIEFCDFYKNRDSGIQLSTGSSDNLILNCDSYMNADMGAGTTSNGGNADGFAVKMDVGSGNIFRGCRSWFNSDDGWDGYIRIAGTIYPDGMTTTLEECWTWKNGYYWLDGTTTSDMNGQGFKLGGSDTKDLAHNFIVKRCLSFYNKSNGFDQNSNAGSITIYNCTSHNNGNKEYMLNSSNAIYAAGSVFTIKNCVAFSSKTSTFKTGTIQSNNNLATQSADFISTDTTGISGKRSVNGDLPNLNFMHLQTNPPTLLIDAGTLIDGILYTGNSPDLGCFEVGMNFTWPTVGIRNNSIENLKIWPNPTQNFIHIDNLNSRNTLFLYSMDGKILKQFQVNSDTEQFDVSDLDKGIYIVKTKYQYFKLIKI